MHIDVVGEGPDLVLLHGWAMHAGIFAPLTQRLARHFRLHLVDLPGHGYSRDDFANFEPAQCAAVLVARLPRAIWVGWSLGGLVALHAALLPESPLRGLAMIASSPRFVGDTNWPHGVKLEVFEQFDAGLRNDYRATIERFLALEALGSKHTQACLHELRAHVFERGEPALAALEQACAHCRRPTCVHACRNQVPSLWLPDAAIVSFRQRCAERASKVKLGSFVEFSSGRAPFIERERSCRCDHHIRAGLPA